MAMTIDGNQDEDNRRSARVCYSKRSPDIPLGTRGHAALASHFRSETTVGLEGTPGSMLFGPEDVSCERGRPAHHSHHPLTYGLNLILTISTRILISRICLACG